MTAWEKYYQSLDALHGGSYEAGTCMPCRHPHPGGVCRCGCTTFTEATEGQVEAYAAYVNYYRAKQHWLEKIEEAKRVEPGDRLRVNRGYAAPTGTCGTVIRTVPSKFNEGTRVLLLVDPAHEFKVDGEWVAEVWTNSYDLCRNSPGVKPGLGDPN